jgi:serine/threonine-protein kinase
LNAGHVIAGKYRLERVVGSGGMGLVWKAWHEGLGTAVAVKMLAAGAERDPGALRRFRREARAAAALRCPHVVDVRDYGLEDGVPYIVMEFLEGESLARRLARAPGPRLSEVSSWVTQAAVAIDYAHARGFLHRDIKPSNLFLCGAGYASVLKVLDFGIVKSLDEAEGGESTVVGSPGYLSPEQARGEGLDHTTDLWSLGAVIYRAVTSVEPFAAPSLAATVERICMRPVPAPSTLEPALPPDLDAFFEQALCREGSGRFRSATALAAAFRAIASQAPDLELPVAASERTDALAPRVESTLSWESFAAHTRTTRPRSQAVRGRRRSIALPIVAAMTGIALVALAAPRVARLSSDAPTERVRAATPRAANPAPRPVPAPPSAPPIAAPANVSPREDRTKVAESAPVGEPTRSLRRRSRATPSSVAAPPPSFAEAAVHGNPMSKPARDPMFGLPSRDPGESDASRRAASTRAFDLP